MKQQRLNDRLQEIYEFGRSLDVDEILINTLYSVPDTLRIPAGQYAQIKKDLLRIIEDDSVPERRKLCFMLMIFNVFLCLLYSS